MDFVEGWGLLQTLGEGAFGEVKLMVHHQTGMAVALKIVRLKDEKGTQMVRKEVGIHRRLTHPNVLKLYGDRCEKGMEYMFLEYASGGELFDRIDPDKGMEPWRAQKYFNQLISGVEYLHNCGVAHRDLKPENLLLDDNNNLKIADFGLATIFRSRGMERTLDKRCGTLTYVAPEVHMKPKYYAQPADIWSCGIILVVLLCGEIPWDKASGDCAEYMAWKDGHYMEASPWKNMDTMPLSLLRRMLAPVPANRSSLRQIKAHRWTTIHFAKELGCMRDKPSVGSHHAKRKCSGSNVSPVCVADDWLSRMCQSQPEPNRPAAEEHLCAPLDSDPKVSFCFSQPAHMDDLIVSSQMHQQSQTSQTTMQKLVRRMTRFFVRPSCDIALVLLSDLLEKLGYTVKRNPNHMLTISCLDKRKMQLVFKSTLLDMNGKTLVDFRLSKGCGLEFKKRFVSIKEMLGDVVLPGLVMWPVAIATNSIP